MNIEELIEEVYEKGPQQYGGYSSGARKDFAPISSKDGYNYPYQRNHPFNNLTTPPPPASISYPWPLQTIVDDLADGFICLINATNKIAECAKNNPALSDIQRKKLLDFYRNSKKALDLIKNVGLEIGGLVNLAGEQPSQNPVPQPVVPQTETLPQQGNTIKIKIP